MAPSAVVFDDVKVAKPMTDYRVYRTAMLSNKMRVLVISDDQCDRSAAALSVGVGSLVDPPEIQGLAHFCEHMLFLGTEKYPSEDEYSSHLAKHGGSSNAGTGEGFTNFYFDVKPEALESSLDRFSQFFIAPLFTAAATDRELNAVDSEHSRNLQSDFWRQTQLLRDSANPDHALNHFMTGNSETLRDIPAKNGTDVRQALLEYHQRYYSANLMCLVLVGRESPEDLLSMAQRLFEPVENTDAVAPRDEELGGGVVAFQQDQLCREVLVVPVKDKRSISFDFVVPSQKPLWRSKPANFLSHLIGHEGSGSLLAALKQRGLATELSSGSSLDEAGVHVFSVTIQLTEEGEKNHEIVGDLFFSLLELLRREGPREDLFREFRMLSTMNFKFRALTDSVTSAANIAHALHDHEPEYALSASALVWDYEPEQISELLSLLRCDRLRVVRTGEVFSDACVESGRWYGTKHLDSPLQRELVSRWSSPAVFADLELPKPNLFVPEDLELRESDSEPHPFAPVSLLPSPSRPLVAGRHVATAHHRKDEKFGLPKAYAAFAVHCPFTAESLRNRILTAIWCEAVEEELFQFSYDALVAGLGYSLQATEGGLLLTVSGYNDKLATLTVAVAKKMASMMEIPESTYSTTTTMIDRNLSNAAFRSGPYQQAAGYELDLVMHPSGTSLEVLEAFRAHGGRDALTGVSRRLLDKAHVECLFQGNMTRGDSNRLLEAFLECVGISEPLEEIPLQGAARLPAGVTLLERTGTNQEERNGAVLVRLDLAPYSLANRGLVDLVAQVLSTRFYDDLRTKQQLGYVVSCAPYVQPPSSAGLRLIVESEKHPRDVLARIQAWQEKSWEHLLQMEESQFAEFRSARVARLLERPKTLNEEFSRNLGQVLSREFAFDQREVMAAQLEALTVEEFKSFVRNHCVGAPSLCVLVNPGCPQVPEGEEWDDAFPLPSADLVLGNEDAKIFRKKAEWTYRSSVIDRNAHTAAA